MLKSIIFMLLQLSEVENLKRLKYNYTKQGITV